MKLVWPAAAAAVVLVLAGIFAVEGPVWRALIFLLAAALGYLAYRGWSYWSKPYSVTFGPDGIAFQVRGRTFDLPWDDIQSLEYGNPWAGRRPSQVVQLLARPAGHVANPTAHPHGVLWSKRGQAWVICEPLQIDGTRAELDAAITRFATGKARLN